MQHDLLHILSNPIMHCVTLVCSRASQPGIEIALAPQSYRLLQPTQKTTSPIFLSTVSYLFRLFSIISKALFQVNFITSHTQPETNLPRLACSFPSAQQSTPSPLGKIYQWQLQWQLSCPFLFLSYFHLNSLFLKLSINHKQLCILFPPYFPVTCLKIILGNITFRGRSNVDLFHL